MITNIQLTPEEFLKYARELPREVLLEEAIAYAEDYITLVTENERLELMVSDMEDSLSDIRDRLESLISVAA